MGLVSMLEDEDFEVTFERPNLSSLEPVSVELSITDVRLKGVDGVRTVVQEFNHRHDDLPVVIEINQV